MKKLRKTLHFAVFFLALTLLCSVLPVSAAPLQPPSMSEAGAVYFYHFENNTVVFEKNADALIPAASTPKIIAGLILCEQLAARQNETVYVTADMIKGSVGYRLGLTKGDQLSVGDLLYAALCGGYNDAFDVLACFAGGTKVDFVQMMNARAAELGATQTLYSDVSGVDDLSKTSALDLGKIALAASQNALYMELTSARSYSIPSYKSFSNRNKLIADPTYHNSKCSGINAGATTNGGNCAVTLITDGEQHYLCVVMGVSADDGQYKLVNRLVAWIPANYGYMDVITPDTPICTLPVTLSDVTSEVEVRTRDTLTCYLPKGLEIGKDITYSLRLEYTYLEAPVQEGEFVGYVVVQYGERTLGRLPLYTTGTANRNFFKATMHRFKEITSHRAFVSGAIFLVVSVSIWIAIEYIVILRRRHKWDKYFSDKMNPPPNASFGAPRNGRRPKKPRK